MDRFNAEFGMRKVEEDDENFDVNLEPHKRAKPDDFENLFGGNNEDCFIMGMKFTKRSIKLYSNFYSSDVIVASPLGLITVSRMKILLETCVFLLHGHFFFPVFFSSCCISFTI
ncbi:hypothetical protein HPP92_003077 [Vanilla planifolia]|uniref:UTP25 NTP hydrolase-like domain-containing protein n=1 Tax=Vanilla planifolia TaxID=51239 RepID=A0A835VJ28_VANPL|nr:hypothetical protein HPP92_003077 [Vanilla planifolia]